MQAHRLQYDMSKSDKVYLKCFPGAVTQDFYDYAKPSQRFNPNMFICHFGTNSLRTNKTAEQIAKDVIDVARELKTEHNCVSVSSITHRNDKLNRKAIQVNSIIKSLCSDNHLGFINNDNITGNHLNNSGLHLNESGTAALARNFLRHINV